MKQSKWITLGYIFLVILFIGIFLISGFLFWIPPLGFLGISFLILSGIGFAFVRRKVSMLKRKNPEAFEALRVESERRIEAEKTVFLKDLPVWLVALLIVVVVIGYMGWFGVFSSNLIFDILLPPLIFLFLIYYFLYKRRVKDKKYSANSHSSGS
jgi:hypothetical protein